MTCESEAGVPQIPVTSLRRLTPSACSCSLFALEITDEHALSTVCSASASVQESLFRTGYPAEVEERGRLHTLLTDHP